MKADQLLQSECPLLDATEEELPGEVRSQEQLVLEDSHLNRHPQRQKSHPDNIDHLLGTTIS